MFSYRLKQFAKGSGWSGMGFLQNYKTSHAASADALPKHPFAPALKETSVRPAQPHAAEAAEAKAKADEEERIRREQEEEEAAEEMMALPANAMDGKKKKKVDVED